MERDFALYRDQQGKTGVLRLKPEAGGWRVVSIEFGFLRRQPCQHITREELSSRLLTREEALLAFREWEAAFRLSQAYVVRPFSPIRAWQARWGWRDDLDGG